MDLLDLTTPHAREVCKGTYYETIPKDATVTGQPFGYEYVDPTSWHYSQLFANVKLSDAATAAIKSKTPLSWKVGAYVRTQDGRFYSILSVQQDFNAAPRQALRIFGKPAGVEYVVRLSEKSEPWGING
jgi:hypothetical protein